MKLLCPACDIITDTKHISKYSNKDKIFDNKNLYQCQDCKLVFIDPMPSMEELDFYYKNIWITYKEAELTYQIQADERFKYLLRHIDMRRCRAVLDVGSGHGYLYESFKKNGFMNIDFHATDPNPDNLHRLKSRGIDAYADLKEIEEREFDIVIIASVLEHVTAPYLFILSVLEYLKEGGYIFIDLPDRDDTFKPIFEPHVAFYSAESLICLVNKLGLEVIHLTGHGRRRSELIAELHGKKNILTLAKNMIGGISKKIKGSVSRENELRNLYKQYKFDEEGIDRWWIRTILRKPLRDTSK